MKTCQNEEQEVFEYLFNTFLSGLSIKGSGAHLNLFITPSCNQNCEYCYLQQHKDELYPVELRDNHVILHNLDLLLDYLMNERHIMYIDRLDLFSGEIWGYPLGNEVLNIILKYAEQGLRIRSMIIPTNYSFCDYPELMGVMNEYLYKFHSYDINLSLSNSMDGPLLDSIMRPRVIGKKTNEFYTNLTHFMMENSQLGYHPMISASTIERQKENYDSWIQLLKDTNSLRPRDFGKIMQLEIRDTSWTKEKIIEYIKWLDYVFTKDLEIYFHNDFREMLTMCYLDTDNKLNHPFLGYIPYLLSESSGQSTCSFGNAMTIRLGDLSIFPCHRSAYPDLNLGHFIIENDKIIKFEGKNIALFNSCYRNGVQQRPLCDTCAINTFCLKTCFAECYEETKELFFPTPQVCELEKAKTVYSCLKFIKMGIMEYFLDDPTLTILRQDINYILELEELQPWKQIISTLI